MRIAGLCVAVVMLSVAPPAAASLTVSVDSSQGLFISVSTGQSDVHVATTTDNRLKVTETGNRPITAGSGCQQGQNPIPGQPFVLCNRPPLAFVTFHGGDLRDALTLTPGVGDCLCTGNEGDDELRGSDGADLIIGGGGHDVLRGGEGGDILKGELSNDTIAAEGGDDVLEGGNQDDALNGGAGTDSLTGHAGADVFEMGGVPDGQDTFDGGTGTDRADYGGRRTAVVVSIDGAANDGAPPPPGQIFGERDNIATNVEDLTGGGGGDTLTGNAEPNRLVGGGGNDTIRGGAAGDFVEGGVGADVLHGEEGPDSLNTRDAIDDQVDAALSCGSEPAKSSATSDLLMADVRDDDTRPLPTDCESVSQGMVGEDPNVHIRSAERVGGEGLVVALRCPRKARTGCEGNLAVKRLAGASARGGGFGERVKYAIERGKRIKVTVPSKARTGALVRIRSLEEGRLGPRTTFRTLEVK